MSLITINNYEAYMLDYVEESLSPELIAELMLFLELNPDLKVELDNFEVHELKPLNQQPIDKSELKKEVSIITLGNYEAFIIAEIEGENSVENSAALHLFVNENPNIKKEFLAYQSTRLVAPTIVFENKSGLKKKSGTVIFMNWMYSSAAAIAIIVFSLSWFTQDERIYVSLSEREPIILNLLDEEMDVLDNVIVIEEKQFVSLLKSAPTTEKENPEEITYKELHNKEENDFAMVDEMMMDNMKDSIPVKNQYQKDNIIAEEELFFAENSVTITYEDELIDENPAPIKHKITKLDLIRAAVKHKVNGNLEKGKEKVLFALNTKPLSFLRKNKNK